MEIPEAKIFGARVKALREKRGLSQEKLANSDRLGDATMTTNYLSDLERGVKVPSLTTVLKLAHALDVPPGELLVDFTPAALRRMFR